MKKRLGREIFWLSVPVVLLGGVALYQSRGGELPATTFSNPFDAGPMRIEFSPLQSVEPTPLDIARGYDWKTRTRVRTVGELDVPSTWRRSHFDVMADIKDLRVVYRRGQVWKQAPRLKTGSLFSRTTSSSTEEQTIQAKLQTVPQDADEVRMRGQFEQTATYRGAIPSGWKAPPNVRHTGLYHIFTISSKPFDVAIKEAGEAWPDTRISKQQKIEVVEGKWLRDMARENLLLRFRAKPDSDINGALECVVDDVRYFDADGKPFKVFQDATSTTEAWSQGTMRERVSPDLPLNEDVTRLMQHDAQPSGGWNSIKMPITITGKVSDGECWPTPFKVQLAPEPGEVRDYGKPKE